MDESVRHLVNASIPAYACPEGTKMYILNLGTLNVDEGWLLSGINSSSLSNLNPENMRRDLMIIASLIEHPEIGLVLFETGCADNIDKWGHKALDLFPRIQHGAEHRLPAAIAATGHSIKDVNAIVMGHLHLDHAGGLENFCGTGVPIYVHEEEFKHACWATGTRSDGGLYIGDYLDLSGDLNWKTFKDSQLDLATGLTIYHCPGHTPGLCILQINLAKSGAFIWTTDQYHIKENFENNHEHGWLLRDYRSWVESGKFIRRLQRIFSATLIFGHDFTVADDLIKAREYYE